MVFGQEVSHDASLRYHILPGSNTMILPVIIFWQILCPRQKVSNSSVNHSTVCFARLCTRPLSRLARSCTRLLSRFALLYKATSFAATNIAKWIVVSVTVDVLHNFDHTNADFYHTSNFRIRFAFSKAEKRNLRRFYLLRLLFNNNWWPGIFTKNIF